MAAHCTYFGDLVRVRYEGDARSVASDVFVDEFKDGAFTPVRSFNSMSNDYACTYAREEAQALRFKLDKARNAS